MEQLPGKDARLNLTDFYTHFSERLKERYGLEITEDDYKLLPKKFKGVFRKNARRTVGCAYIDGRRVWCLLDVDHKCMSTCYPPDIEEDVDSAIRACFGEQLRVIATMIYETYRHERDTVRKDFETEKEAALHYFEHCMFPTLHIDLCKKGSVPMFKIMHKIRGILDGESFTAKLAVVKIKHDV